MKQQNLFIVGTPYQFLSAVSICVEKFGKDSYENTIYFLKSDRTNYNISNLGDQFNGQIFRFEKQEWVELVQKLQQQSFERFFFYQENEILNKYLAYQLKKKGTIICLGPDGTKPYGEFNKDHEFLSMIKDTLSDYKILKKYNLKLPKLIWSRYYKYGATNLLDEVWLQYPDLFNSTKNKAKAKIVKIPSLKSNHIQLLSRMLDFRNTQLSETDGLLLYFNQPFYSKELITKEFEILQELSNQFPNKKINIKLHPSTKKEVKLKMMNLPYIYLIEDNLPGEFYLGIVSNSILLTGWSAALMHEFENSTNSNFYLYPLYKNLRDKTMSQVTLVGFPHITMVENIEEITFPNE